MSSQRRRRQLIVQIAHKANKILNLFLIGILLILLRVWHLSVVQHDERVEAAYLPKKRQVAVPSPRATIRDRFNEPLALNRISYQVAVFYPHILEVPSISWEKDPWGNKIKRLRRKEYIRSFSEMAAQELSLSPDRIEDLIHSTAVYYGQRPFILATGISEEQFYRLKAMEKDWPGLMAMIVPQRYYPLGKVGADVIGYVGEIDRKEYLAIMGEIRMLRSFLEGEIRGDELELPPGVASSSEAEERLSDLEQRAYQIQDTVGKTGIEGQYEEELRGFHGTRCYMTDAKGNVLREMPESRPSIPGQRILLTISAELQEYAEKLLIENESIRNERIGRNEDKQIENPWIKGGAIVVLEPSTGEVLALAGYPRFDPNDFAGSGDRSQKLRWLELEEYLADVWNGQQPLKREEWDKQHDKIDEKELYLSWNQYLDFICPRQGNIRKALERFSTVREAVKLHRLVEPFGDKAGYLLNTLYPEAKQIPAILSLHQKDLLQLQIMAQPKLKKSLDPYLKDHPNHRDTLLAIDVSRLVLCSERFDDQLLEHVGHLSLSEFHNYAMAQQTLFRFIKEEIQSLHHEIAFVPWRRNNEVTFLKEKRKKEIEGKLYAKPYIDYLDKEEKEQFDRFWSENRQEILLLFVKGEKIEGLLAPYCDHFFGWSQEIIHGAHGKTSWRPSYDLLRKITMRLNNQTAIKFLSSLRSFNDLNRPLLGKYRAIRNQEGQQLERHLAMAFYPKYGFGFSRSHAYRQAAPQASVFKLMTSYAALKPRYDTLRLQGKSLFKLNPLVINEIPSQVHGVSCIASFENGEGIPYNYKGGRLMKSIRKNIGKIDLVGALESSSNPYFSVLAGDILKNPDELAETARLFGYGKKTGVELPGEFAGFIPTDLKTNKSGLYALAIGQHTLVVTPLQTAMMMAAMGNGGELLRPKIVRMTVGSSPARGFGGKREAFPYQDDLAAIGINFPLYIALDNHISDLAVTEIPKVVRRRIDVPIPVKNIIFEGMRQVVSKGQEGKSLWPLVNLYRSAPEAIASYVELKKQLIGKTGTGERVELMSLEEDLGTKICHHIWFSGFSFDHDLAEPFTLQTEKDLTGTPELVVVVYFKYGGYGKDAAPVMAQIVKKWREITKKKSSRFTKTIQ